MLWWLLILLSCGTGLPQLQRLKDAEGDTLRRLVLKSLIILERVLQSKEALPASSTSSLEHYLLSMETTVSANALYAQDDIPGTTVEFQLCASALLLQLIFLAPPDKMKGLSGREVKKVHVIAVIANYINASKVKGKLPELPLYATKYDPSLFCA